MEHKHHQSSREGIPLKRQLLAGVMAASVLTTLTAEAMTPPPVQRAVEKTVEKYVPRDNRGEQVEVGPEYTIIMPPQGRKAMMDYSVTFANEKELREAGQFCDVPNVPLFREASPENIEAVANTPMSLEYDEYLELDERIEKAKRESTIRSIVRDTYAKAGVKVTFNASKEGLNVAYDSRKTKFQRESEFKRGMSDQLLALTFLPKETFAKNPPAFDFMDGDHISYTYTDEDGKAHERHFAGLYSYDSRKIVINSRASASTTLHEVGHYVHHTACEGRTDSELGYLQEWGAEELRTDPYVKTIYDELPKDGDGTWQSSDTNLEMRDLTSFPSGYSVKGDPRFPGSEIGEFQAEAFSETLLNGQISSDNPHQLPTAKMLEQTSLERMKKAMPGVDVASLAAVQAAYAESGIGRIPAHYLAKNRVSVFDCNFSETLRDPDEHVVIRPAIRIATADGKLDSYIFSMEEDIHSVPGGRDGGQYMIMLRSSGEETLDESLVQMAFKYYQDMAKRKDITLDYRVEYVQDFIYVTGWYRADGVALEIPQLMRAEHSGKGAGG